MLATRGGFPTGVLAERRAVISYSPFTVWRCRQLLWWLCVSTGICLVLAIPGSARAACGDVNSDGIVDEADKLAVRQAIAGIIAALPVPFACNVTGLQNLSDANLDGLPDDCDLADSVVLRRFCSQLPPGIQQVCQGPLPADEPQATGTGQEPAAGADDADAAAVYGPARGNAPGSSTLLSSGEKRLDRVDLRIAGRGQVDFVLSRRYRSQLGYDGPMGHGWDFSYNERLHVQGNGDVVRNDGHGRVDTWVSQGGGVFTAPAGQFGTLRQEADTSYTLRQPDGFKHSYDATGRLTGHMDRHGNTMSFSYDARGNLQRATDPYGRSVDFVFATFADGRDRLVTVRDFQNREVVYSYTTNFDLAQTRSPVVVGTSTGDDFADGRTEGYSYREGSGDANLDHNLLTVTYPEEFATSGTPAITIAYGESAGPAYDRVTSEVVGGTNASGVAAGGTVEYGYTPVNQAAGPDPDLSRLDVAVNERNGNQLVVQINERDHLIVEQRLTRGLRPGEPASYDTRSYYDLDGQLTRQVYPLGNELQHTYGSGDRAAQANVVVTERIADPARGGGTLRVERTYEPLYQQLASESDPREHTAGFVPPINPTVTSDRYISRWYYDYQEGSATVPEAADWDISLAGVARGLGDLNADGVTTDAAGDNVREEEPTVHVAATSNMAGVLGDTTQEIVWERRWNARGQLTAEIDPEGSITTYDYYPENDPDGDGVTVAGQSSTLGRGYLRARIVDANTTARRTAVRTPEALESHYAYSPGGAVIRERDPRGVVTDYEVNALGEVVVETRAADTAQAIVRGQLPTGEAPFQYETRHFHDHNGRVIRTEVEDDPAVTTTAGVGAFIEHVFSHDILGNRVVESHEVGAGAMVRKQYSYDEHELRTQTTYPKLNVDTVSYDERHLPYLITEGAGSLEAGTYQYDYDDNGNLSRRVDAEDHDGDVVGDSTLYTYDGHDRLRTTTTPMGTVTELFRDPAGNVNERQIDGHPGNQPGAPNQTLSNERYTHDELNRTCRIDKQLFVVPSSETPIRPVFLFDGGGIDPPDGWVTEMTEHDGLGRTRFAIEDDTEVTEYRYDGAGRRAESIDALGNRVETYYDANGNPIRVVSIETMSEPGLTSAFDSPAPAVPDQVRTTYYVYDQLDRIARVSDSLGQTYAYGYDSRGNQTTSSDANGPLMGVADPLGVFPGVINDAGNTRTNYYDGADRRVAEVTDLRVGGVGGAPLDTSNLANSDGQITVSFGYDDNGNLTSITDDNTNDTQFGFDARDRRVSRTLANGAIYSFGYDRDSNLVSTGDPNGTTVAYSYDADNRRIQADVTRGAGVLGTTQQTWGYDGLGNMTRSTDDNTTPPLIHTRILDSLGRVLEAVQGIREVPTSFVYSGDGDAERIQNQSGDLTSYFFDDLDRVKNIQSGLGGEIVRNIIRIGPGNRELERHLASDNRIRWHDTLGNLDGYDAVGREVGFEVTEFFGGEVIKREYTYDRNGSRLSERRLDSVHPFEQAEQGDNYVYDSACRVVQSRFDEGGVGGAAIRNHKVLDYQYDGVGNRVRVTRSDDLLTVPEETHYTSDNVNQYTAVGGVARGYDANGNLIDDGTRSYEYDFNDRLVRVVNNAFSAELATYAYDAEGRRVRRIQKDVAGMVLDDLEYYYDNRDRVVEQWDFVGNETRLTQVYGPRAEDEVVYQNIQSSSFQAGVPRETWYIRNPRNDLIATAQAFGSLLQKFIYDDFGAALITIGPSVFPPYLFQGKRFDFETGHYVWGPRFFDPGTGRFNSRDPGVYDERNAGNPYSYVGNSPTTFNDPSGRSADLHSQ